MADTKSEASDPLMFKVLNQFRANGHLTATLPSYTVYDSTPDAGVVHLSSNGTWDEKTSNDEQTGSSDEHPLLVAGAGRLPEDVYERTLVWWRAAIRRTIVKSVAWESKVLAGMQVGGSVRCR
ncbi:hypothetical protein A0H81_02685 [Grifola frondosa]|uniref:Uncharacterized protein n=1 Tax=Grifola frondosa TaxID=5627 RepID=A0A1C7MST6_GRIFR|nr:hypothetical protein A0H81_02685 [Grifola frondosa]